MSKIYENLCYSYRQFGRVYHIILMFKSPFPSLGHLTNYDQNGMKATSTGEKTAHKHYRTKYNVTNESKYSYLW